jgi:hypothetical protein
MPDSGRGRLTPSKRKFLRAAAILQFALPSIRYPSSLVGYFTIDTGTKFASKFAAFSKMRGRLCLSLQTAASEKLVKNNANGSAFVV